MYEDSPRNCSPHIAQSVLRDALNAVEEASRDECIGGLALASNRMQLQKLELPRGTSFDFHPWKKQGRTLSWGTKTNLGISTICKAPCGWQQQLAKCQVIGVPIGLHEKMVIIMMMIKNGTTILTT